MQKFACQIAASERNTDRASRNRRRQSRLIVELPYPNTFLMSLWSCFQSSEENWRVAFVLRRAITDWWASRSSSVSEYESPSSTAGLPERARAESGSARLRERFLLGLAAKQVVNRGAKAIGNPKQSVGTDIPLVVFNVAQEALADRRSFSRALLFMSALDVLR